MPGRPGPSEIWLQAWQSARENKSCARLTRASRWQERKAIAKEGLKLDRLTGADLTPRVWDQFYRFYRNTTGAALAPLGFRVQSADLTPRVWDQLYRFYRNATGAAPVPLGFRVQSADPMPRVWDQLYCNTTGAPLVS